MNYLLPGEAWHWPNFDKAVWLFKKLVVRNFASFPARKIPRNGFFTLDLGLYFCLAKPGNFKVDIPAGCDLKNWF